MQRVSERTAKEQAQEGELICMGKTSTAVKNRYNAKTYEQLNVRVHKGERARIAAFANERGESVNGMINRLVYSEMNKPVKQADTQKCELI